MLQNIKPKNKSKKTKSTREHRLFSEFQISQKIKTKIKQNQSSFLLFLCVVI